MSDNIRGTLPSPLHRENAKTLFYNNEQCSCEKLAAHVSMHRDAIGDLQDYNERLDRTMHGDPSTNFPGLKFMITEMWERETGNKATDALYKNKGMYDRWQEVSKYVYIGVGIILAVQFILPLIWTKVFG